MSPLRLEYQVDYSSGAKLGHRGKGGDQYVHVTYRKKRKGIESQMKGVRTVYSTKLGMFAPKIG